MHHRILDFSQVGVRLRVKNRQLIVFQEEWIMASVPLEDIAVVLLSHPQITLSQAVLEGLCNAGAVTVFCNNKSMPTGLCYPLVGHHLQSNRMQVQATASKPLLKRLWQQVVRKKIEFQAKVLSKLFQNDFELPLYAKSVRSGDTNNREGQAAKRYWSKLFAGIEFRRKPSGDDFINITLNYGYGVLRALTARAISASGLHPSLGMFHHNKYNPYCLADDLMEPFRPVVDFCVYHLFEGNYLNEGLNSGVKECVIGQLIGRYTVNGFQETLFETITKMTESLARVFMEKQLELVLPADLPLTPFKPPARNYKQKQSVPEEQIPMEQAPF